MRDSVKTVLEEITRTVANIPLQEQEELAEQILKANAVFVAGMGRSGLMAGCFAMRLMHMGFQVYRVGEVTTPAIKEGDLLIIASGSGTTESLVKMAEKAKKIGAEIATVTIYPEAAIGRLSSSVVCIHAPTSKSEIDTGTYSVQPMGSLFEQSLLICFDYIIKILMEKKNITGEEMFLHHANLE